MQPPTPLALVQDIARIAQHRALPRVVRLHLPPDSDPATSRAEFCALELADGSLGLTYLKLERTREGLRSTRIGGRLAGADPQALAEGFVSDEPGERAIGLAAINAISQHLFAAAEWAPPAAGDSIGGIAPAAGERVGMVGLFAPLVKRIVDGGARLTVLELAPPWTGEREGWQLTDDPAALADCTSVLCTSTVLLNGTLERIRAACPAATRFALIGPSAGAVPDALFAAGVTVVAGNRVIDRDRFVGALVAGERWGPFAAKYEIDAAHWPGLGPLLARAEQIDRGASPQ